MPVRAAHLCHPRLKGYYIDDDLLVELMVICKPGRRVRVSAKTFNTQNSQEQLAPGGSSHRQCHSGGMGFQVGNDE